MKRAVAFSSVNLMEGWFFVFPLQVVQLVSKESSPKHERDSIGEVNSFHHFTMIFTNYSNDV